MIRGWEDYLRNATPASPSAGLFMRSCSPKAKALRDLGCAEIRPSWDLDCTEVFTVENFCRAQNQ